MDLRDSGIDIPKKIRSLSFHNFMGLCSVFLLVLVDSFFLGLKSELDLTTAVFSSPLIFFFVNIFMGAANAKMVFVSKNIGLSKNELISKSNVIDVMILGAYLVLMLLLFFNINLIVDLFSIESDLKEKSIDYIQIHYATALFCIYNTLCAAFLRGLGDSRLPAKIMLTSSLFNLILDPIFIFYFDWGSNGAAAATGCAWLFSSLYMTYHLRIKEKSSFELRIFKLKDFLSTVPSFVVGQILNPITVLMLFYVIAEFGISVVSGVGLGIRIDKFVVIVGFAFGGALSVFVGQNIENKERTLTALRSTLHQSLLLSFLISSSFYLLSDYLGMAFNLGEESSEVLKAFMLYSIPTSMLTAMYVINTSYFNASNNHGVVFKSNVIKTFLTLPLLLFFFVEMYGWRGALISLFLNALLSNVILLSFSCKDVRRSYLKAIFSR